MAFKEVVQVLKPREPYEIEPLQDESDAQSQRHQVPEHIARKKDIDIRSKSLHDSQPQCEDLLDPILEYRYKSSKWLRTSYVNLVRFLASVLSSLSVVLYWVRYRERHECQCCTREDDTDSLWSDQKALKTLKVASVEDFHQTEDSFPNSEKGWNAVKDSCDENGAEDTMSNFRDFGEDVSPKKLPSSLRYLFTYFKPAVKSAAVYPVSLQNPKPGQSSGGRKEPDEEPPRPPPRDPRWPPESVHGMPWATFREELHRLGTFVNMPPDSPVFALRLAHAGFLRLPEGFVVCYFCGLRRDVWHAGESPAEVHRQLRPRCPMSTGADCDNRPVDVLAAERLEELMRVWSLSGPPLLPGRAPTPQGQRAEAERSDAGPLPPKATPLASAERPGAGGPRTVDVTEDGHPPASGSGAEASRSANRPVAPAAASNQNAGDDRASGQQQPRPGLMGGAAKPGAGGAPLAPIFDGTAQPEARARGAETRSASASEPRAGQVVTYQQLGIVTDAPKRPDMAMVNARVGTFRSWPATNSHTPLELSEAGFYHAGYADCGRCFFCGGGLKNWEPADNPWVEHARWFPKCAYIRQCQGQDFIDVVQELNGADRRQISLAQVREEIGRRRADGERIQEPAIDPAVLSALELGYSQEAVDAAVQSVQREGHQLTAARLMDSLQAGSSLAAGGDDGLADVSGVSDAELGRTEELVAENGEVRQQRLCKICLDKEVAIVFLPCGHLVCCTVCSPALKHCPMCRQRVKGRVRAFPT